MSAGELFPAEAVAMESPRLRWLREHGVTIKVWDWTGTDLEGSNEPRFQCILSGPSISAKDYRLYEDGPREDTEDQAIESLALQMGWRLWNET